MTKFFDTIFGEVELRNCMVSLDKHNIIDVTKYCNLNLHILCFIPT